MDLRKLQNEQNSVLIRFKKRMSSAFRYVFTFLLIGALAGVGFVLYRHYKFTQMQKTPIKVYKAVSPPSQENATSEKTDASPPVFSTEVETSQDSQILETPADTEDTVDSTPSTDSAAAASQPHSGNTSSESDEEARNVEELLKAKKSEVDQALADGDALLSQARQTLNQAILILADHLKTLSPEEQRTFLNQIKSQMYNPLTPELQVLLETQPEIMEKGWQMYLDMLTEAGYTVPEGIR